MKRDQFVGVLRTLGACSDRGDAVPWAEGLPAETTAAEAWALCSRGDWLVWLLGALLGRETLSRQTLVLAACAAARVSLVDVSHGDDRPRAAVDLAEAWAQGRASISEVRSASAGAGAAVCDAGSCLDVVVADAAASVASCYVAYFAFCAANSALAAALSADQSGGQASAFFADASVSDACAAASSSGRSERLMVIADAVRAAVPWATVEAAVARLCEGGVL